MTDNDLFKLRATAKLGGAYALPAVNHQLSASQR